MYLVNNISNKLLYSFIYYITYVIYHLRTTLYIILHTM